MTDVNATAMPACANCNKVQDSGEVTLQRCSGCRAAYYCSKDCQKADWKNHKKTCRSSSSTDTGASQTGGSSFFSSKGTMENLLGLNTSTWLHDCPEAEVYTLLIDSYRMRVEDDYAFRGDVSDDSIYGGGNPVKGFRRFLQKAEARSGVLPSWWNAEKRKACIAKGNAKDHWSSLHFAVEKSDIQEHYKNNMMPMQLRMLAEEIIGTNVMDMGQ